MPRAVLRRSVLFFLLLSLSSPQIGYCQMSPQVSIEKATSETDRLKRQQLEDMRRIPKKPPEIKPEEVVPVEGEAKFFVKKIMLTGCESFSPETFATIVQPYENKEVTLSELNALAREIERDYLKRGIIAAVLVPEQDIKDQTVTLRVIEARMGKIDIEGNTFFRDKMLSGYWKVKPGDIMKYDKISRSVQLMNRNPDREVRAVLHAGAKPGTTDVLLNSKTNFPVHLTYSIDNEGSRPTGRLRETAGIKHNNLLGLDDTFAAGYSFGKDFNGEFGFHNIPINHDGASVLYGYSRSKASPKRDFTPFGIRADADLITMSLHQDFYGMDGYKGEAFLGFDAEDKTTKLEWGTYSRNRLRIFRLGGNFLLRGDNNVTQFSPQYSQGVRAFGASPENNPLAERGAQSLFSKFNMGVQHRHMLPFDIQGVFRFNSQVAAEKLTPQEEVEVGGIDSVRGYPYGDFLADNAVVTNAELLIPPSFMPKEWRIPYSEAPLKELINGLVFVDYGWGRRRGALFPGERETVNFASTGAGLRVKLFNQVFARCEWGFVLGDRALTESGRSRFHFSIDIEEKLPEEIARIKEMRKSSKN